MVVAPARSSVSTTKPHTHDQLWAGLRRVHVAVVDLRVHSGVIEGARYDGFRDSPGAGAVGRRAFVVVPLPARYRADDQPRDDQHSDEATDSRAAASAHSHCFVLVCSHILFSVQLNIVLLE